MNWQFEQKRIYSTDEKGRLIAETKFHQNENGETDIDHTYVDPCLRGQGIAGNMMSVVAEHLRKKETKVTASCSYANLWFKRNKKTYSDIISENMFNEALACRISAKQN